MSQITQRSQVFTYFQSLYPTEIRPLVTNCESPKLQNSKSEFFFNGWIYFISIWFFVFSILNLIYSLFFLFYKKFTIKSLIAMSISFGLSLLTFVTGIIGFMGGYVKNPRKKADTIIGVNLNFNYLIWNSLVFFLGL